jgi:hypothetical protein
MVCDNDSVAKYPTKTIANLEKSASYRFNKYMPILA